MGIKKSQVNRLTGITTLGSLHQNLDTVGNYPVFTSPTDPSIIRIFGTGEGGFIWNDEGAAVDWQLRRGTTVLWDVTGHTGQSGDSIYRPILFQQGDAACNFEFVFSTSGPGASNINLHFTWTDVVIGSNQGVDSTATNGTTRVKVTENTTPGLVRQLAGLPIGGEASLEPGYWYYNLDDIDHGLTWYVSPDNGSTFFQGETDGGTFRDANRVDVVETTMGLKNGESFWVQLNEPTNSVEGEFRLFYEDIPETP